MTRILNHEALAASSSGWAEGENDYPARHVHAPGDVRVLCQPRRARSAAIEGGKGEDVLRSYFANLVGTVTKRKILDDNPALSKRTVERMLQKLQAEGHVEKVGAARATAYRRKG